MTARMANLLRRIIIISLGLASLALSSCGAARSLIQIPARTLQSAVRTVGVGLEATEITENEDLSRKDR